MLIGEAPCMKDMIETTDHDFKVVNLISILAVFAIILLVERSLSLPFLLVAVIELGIFINLGLLHYMGQSLPFIAPICISTIQLGATVDYAILLTTRYKEERVGGRDKKDAVTTALGVCAPSILVSGFGLFAATFGLAVYSNIDIIRSMCIQQVTSILLDRYGGSTEVIVVCGSNHELEEDVRKSLGGRCTVLGFTDQMADYMKACDVFLSKPGGLSSTEAAAVGTAFIHITPIPGCETSNMHFFAENGMSLAVTSPEHELIDACDRLLDGAAREQMIEAQRRVIPGNAATAICELLEEEYEQLGSSARPGT